MNTKLECGCSKSGCPTSPEWISLHVSKCLNRTDCGRCNKPKSVWPNGSSNMCSSCDAVVTRKMCGPYIPLS